MFGEVVGQNKYDKTLIEDSDCVLQAQNKEQPRENDVILCSHLSN